MDVMRTGLVSALIFAVSLQSGCSFLFVKGPPDNHTELATFEQHTEGDMRPVQPTVLEDVHLAQGQAVQAPK